MFFIFYISNILYYFHRLFSSKILKFEFVSGKYSLRLSSQLLFGVIKIYKRQVDLLLHDVIFCRETKPQIDIIKRPKAKKTPKPTICEVEMRDNQVRNISSITLNDEVIPSPQIICDNFGDTSRNLISNAILDRGTEAFPIASSNLNVSNIIEDNMDILNNIPSIITDVIPPSTPRVAELQTSEILNPENVQPEDAPGPVTLSQVSNKRKKRTKHYINGDARTMISIDHLQKRKYKHSRRENENESSLENDFLYRCMIGLVSEINKSLTHDEYLHEHFGLSLDLWNHDVLPIVPNIEDEFHSNNLENEAVRLVNGTSPLNSFVAGNSISNNTSVQIPNDTVQHLMLPVALTSARTSVIQDITLNEKTFKYENSLLNINSSAIEPNPMRFENTSNILDNVMVLPEIPADLIHDIGENENESAVMENSKKGYIERSIESEEVFLTLMPKAFEMNFVPENSNIRLEDRAINEREIYSNLTPTSVDSSSFARTSILKDDDIPDYIIEIENCDRLLSESWNPPQLLVKIIEAEKKGIKNANIEKLVEIEHNSKPPSIITQKMACVRAFSSLLNLKAQGYVKVKKMPDSLQIQHITANMNKLKTYSVI